MISVQLDNSDFDDILLNDWLPCKPTLVQALERCPKALLLLLLQRATGRDFLKL